MSKKSKPLTLGEIDPSTVVDDKQIYDDDIDSFLKICFNVDYHTRLTVKDLENHLFIKREINWEAGRRSWSNVFYIIYFKQMFRFFIANSPAFKEFNKERSLYTEMCSVYSSLSDLNPDLLLRSIYAINLTKADFFPVFDKVNFF